MKTGMFRGTFYSLPCIRVRVLLLCLYTRQENTFYYLWPIRNSLFQVHNHSLEEKTKKK